MIFEPEETGVDLLDFEEVGIVAAEVGGDEGARFTALLPLLPTFSLIDRPRVLILGVRDFDRLGLG